MNVRSKGSSESKDLLAFQNSDAKGNKQKLGQANGSLNLQKLRTEVVTADHNQGLIDPAGDRMDLLINKQSFSANPRELKKQAE